MIELTLKQIADAVTGIEEAGRFAAAMSTLKIEKSGPFNGNKEDVFHCIETAEEMF